MSDSLWPHGLLHNRPSCPTPYRGICSNSYPLNWWCHPTISSSIALFSSCSQSFPASGFFPVSWLSHQVAKLLEIQHQNQSFQWIFRVDFLQDWLIGSPCYPRDSQESSPTPEFKASILWCLALFMVQLSQPYITTRKTIALTIRDLCWQWCLCFWICCLGLS